MVDMAATALLQGQMRECIAGSIRLSYLVTSASADMSVY